MATSNNSEVQKFRSSEVQKFRSSEVQKFRSSEVQLYIIPKCNPLIDTLTVSSFYFKFSRHCLFSFSFPLFLTVSLLGCADSTRTKVEATALGTIAGGGAGYAIGGKPGAAIGAGIGFLVGIFTGSKIAARKQEYADRQEAIREEIAFNQRYIEEVRVTNQKLEEEVQDYEQQLAFIREKKRSNTLTEMDSQRQTESQQALQENVQLAQTAFEEVEKELHVSRQRYEQYQGDTADSSSQWQNEISELAQEKNTLKNHVANLMALSR